MNPLLNIRKNVIKVTQTEMADLAKTRQGTVSRWEKGELEPSRDQMALIRESALQRGLAWDDSWFFTVPAQDNEAEQGRAA